MIRGGIPSIVVVTERFVKLANSIARAQGVPEAPMILLPKSEHIEYAGATAMEAAADAVLERFVDTFVQGVTP